MQRSAAISADGVFRYELRRVWDRQLPILPVCMLNPSTADAEKDDPTVLALIHFAKLWGYGGILIVNLYAFRTSKPVELWQAGSPMGGVEQERYTAWAVKEARDGDGKLLVAWGNGGSNRGRWFARYAECNGARLVCLGTTKSGEPKHPMARGNHRIPRDQQPIPWSEPQ